MVELTDEQFEAAKRQGKARLQRPRATSVRYDVGRGRVIIALSTGVELGLVPRNVEDLAGATPEDLKSVVIDSQGLGIHFPKLDADLYAPALLDGVLGSQRWMIARSGTMDGKARGPIKPDASRQSSRRGSLRHKPAVGE